MMLPQYGSMESCGVHHSWLGALKSQVDCTRPVPRVYGDGIVRHLPLLALTSRALSSPARTTRQDWFAPPLIGHWITGAPSLCDPPDTSSASDADVVMRYV